MQILLQMTIQNRVVNRGIGRAIDSAGHSEDAVYEVIADVLKNPRFLSFANIRKGIKRLGISGILLAGTETTSERCPATNACRRTPSTRQ